MPMPSPSTEPTTCSFCSGDSVYATETARYCPSCLALAQEIAAQQVQAVVDEMVRLSALEDAA